MIYLVSNQQSLFDNSAYKTCSVFECLEEIKTWNKIQYDSETTGRDARLCNILCIQFGNKIKNIQYVIDITTIDILNFKEILETKLLIGHNLKFDLQFLYNYEIIPLNVWDTMIIEQLLHLGFDPKNIKYSLQEVAKRRLNVDIDKTVRGEIIWRGLDTSTIIYAAGDVVYLEDIQEQQLKELNYTKSTIAAKVENNFVPVIAYLEWCGIKLDVERWKLKMQQNESDKEKATEALDAYVVSLYENNPTKFHSFIDLQLNLFDECLHSNINWSSSKQVIPFVQLLGFSTKTEDRKTGESKDSVVEKLLKQQKGIDDHFLDLYFKYQETVKVCSTYGQNYLDAVNPNTGRIHTTFKQLGAASGRMSCGNGLATNSDLAKIKKIPASRCKYVQLQNLPADNITRSCFVSEPDNLMCSCDYSALESRLGADIYNEQSMIKEYLEGSGDIHSLTAKHCFKELADVEVKDIAKVRPDLRKKAKPVEFSQQFGGSAKAIQNALGCTSAEAKEIANAYNSGFKGIAEFKKRGAEFLATNGYVLICKKTGHKVYWENYHKWKDMIESPIYIQEQEYSKKEIQELSMEYSKWANRMSLNAPTQGSGIIILKIAMTTFFKWIIKNNLFSKVLICDLVHDEAVIEYPKTRPEISDKLRKAMEKAAELICTKLPIPAVPEVGDHWIH